MKKYLLLFFILLGLGMYGYSSLIEGRTNTPVNPEAKAKETDRLVRVPIVSGSTFGVLAESQSVGGSTITAIMEASEGVYDFTSIRAGKELLFYFDRQSGELQKLSYEPNTEEQVVMTFRDGAWTGERTKIDYEVRQKKISGTIESSLYETALVMNFDERVIISLAEVFAWQIDFAVDIRTGDSFSMIYEERYRDGEYVMPGTILAAQFSNGGTIYQGYYYQNGSDDGYFDPEGKSLEKIFLKSPLQYRYISSGYTGARIDPINGHTRPHRAIDYAAAYGTPSVTVGDGTVTRAGWYGGYGYSVDVRHNDTYMTRYGHFSKLAVKSGAKVKQGQIVGYVGSTGHSTGPHLHYELYKNGAPINPLNVELPASNALLPELLPAFQEHIKQFAL